MIIKKRSWLFCPKGRESISQVLTRSDYNSKTERKIMCIVTSSAWSWTCSSCNCLVGVLGLVIKIYSWQEGNFPAPRFFFTKSSCGHLKFTTRSTRAMWSRISCKNSTAFEEWINLTSNPNFKIDYKSNE